MAENSHLCVRALSLHSIIFTGIPSLFMFLPGCRCSEGDNRQYERYNSSLTGGVEVHSDWRKFHMADIFILPFT